MRGEDVGILVLLGALGVFLLASAALLAMHSRRPVKRRPPKRTFEHGRRLARQRHARTTDEAVAGLRDVPIGVVLEAQANDRAADVVVKRKKGQTCPQAAGFLAGLFEAVWAHEVRVVHPACAGEKGGDCRYHVERAAPAAPPSSTRVSASGVPTGGASTPGSKGDRRRSPPARAGGG